MKNQKIDSTSAQKFVFYKMPSPIKVVLTGDENVGKSSIALRLKHNKFSDMYIATIGVDFCFTDVNKNHLQIWDTAGQERFRTNHEAYYRGINVILYVYDMTNKASFDYLNTHIADVQKLCPVNTVQYLVATKSDKPEYGATRSDIDTLVAKFNLKADYQVSSKSGETVKTMFHDMFKEGVHSTLEPAKEPAKELKEFDEVLRELAEVRRELKEISNKLTERSTPMDEERNEYFKQIGALAEEFLKSLKNSTAMKEEL